jgi:PAS domain S-box-containing protein
MSLRRKTISAISVTMVSLIVILYGLARFILLDSFVRLEESDTRQHTQRALAALSDDVAQLDSAAGDWASWDDTYAFVENLNEDYIQANLTDSTFVTLRLNLMLFVNTAGQAVFSQGFDLRTEQQTPIAPDAITHILANASLMHHTDPDSAVSGVVTLPAGPMLITSHPILTSAHDGPIHGALIFGRYLNSAEIERLAGLTQLSISLERLEASDTQAVRSMLSNNTTIVVRPMDERTVAGYTLLTDVGGQPALILKVTAPRSIYAQGQISVSYFVLALVAVGFVFSAGATLFLDRLVLRRLGQLGASISRIRANGDLAARVPSTGQDEVAGLGQAINEMLTGLQRSAETLRESEQRFHWLFTTSPDAILLIDPHDPNVDRPIVDCNEAACQMNGFAREELIGQSIDMLNVAPATLEERRAYLDRLQREGVVHLETFHRHKDGHIFPIEVSTSIFTFEGHELVLGIDRDITERKRAEAALAQAEQRYRNLFEEAPVMYVITRNQAGVPFITDCNRLFLDRMGYARDEVLDRPLADFYAPASRARLLADGYQRALAGDILLEERELLTRNNRIIATLLQTRLELGAEGQANGTRAMYLDITERKQAEEALRDSERRERERAAELQTIMDAVPASIWIAHDQMCRVITGNHASYQLLRMSPDSNTSLTASEDQRPAHFKIGKDGIDLPPTELPIQITAATGVEIREFELDYVFDDGVVIHMLGNVKPLFDERGQPRGAVGAFIDITERRQAEEAIKEKQRRDQMILESVTVPMIISRISDSRVLYANQALTQVGHITLEELLGGRTVDFFINRDDRDRVAEILRRQGHVSDFETQLRRGDGVVHWVLLSSRIIHYQNETCALSSYIDISARKQMEEALRESETKLHSVIEQSWDGIAVTDEQGRIIEWNQRAEQITGLSRTEAIGQPIWDIQFRLAPDGQRTSTAHERLKATLLSLLETGQSPLLGKLLNAEVQLSDGTHRFIEQSVFTVKTDRGYILCGILRDVTERRQTEAQVARLAAIVDQSADAIVMTDMSAKITYVNRFFEQNTGYSAAEVLGQPVWSLDSGQPDQAVFKHMTETLRAGQIWTGRMISRRKDGSLFYEDAMTFSIKDALGRSTGFAAILRDVTERQQHEREMEAIAIIATALRAAPSRAEMMPVILHQMMSIMSLDSAALALKHAPTGELAIPLAVGDWSEWTGGRLSDDAGISSQVIKTRQPFVSLDAATDRRIDTRDQLGQVRSVMCVPLIEGGLAFGALWIGHRAPHGFVNHELRWLTAIADIAANALHRATVLETLELRVVERTRELTEANQKLQELDQMKDQFVSNVSHELRTPLTSIILQIELLQHGKPDRRDVYLGTLRRESDRLRKMIEDLLDLSRLDRGMTPIQPAPTDLNPLLGQLVADRAALAAERGLSLEFAPTPDLPPAMVDVSMLAQVISNLVTNALNYTSAGGHVMVTTARQLREDLGWVTFTVCDTGPGISAKDRPHLFERFYRGDVGRKASAPGTGLGLAICKEIVMKHGGQITVESEPGQGAVFTVWLKPE